MDSPQPKRITMRMLAERLGVTKTTVSLALRGHPGISESTTERVVNLAREMGYRPDPAISAIAAQRWSCGSSQRHRVIAFLCHHTASGKMSQAAYFAGARDRADELGFKLVPFFVDEYPTATSITRVLDARGIRGIIVPPIPNPSSKRALRVDWSKFTSVCCGIGRVRPPLHTVTSDLLTTTRTVWEVVAKAGFKRIGAALFCHSPHVDEDWQRIGASYAAQHFLGLEESASIPILTTGIEKEDALMRWYEKHKPEVIIGFNYSTGEVLERHGLRMPEDVQFVSLTSRPGSKWTGILPHIDQIARSSVDVLNDELRENRWGLPSSARVILIKPEWNRGTTFTHQDLDIEPRLEARNELLEYTPFADEGDPGQEQLD